MSLLRERPGDPAASVTLNTRRGELQVAIESAGGMRDAELLVHLAGCSHRGHGRLRLELPAAGAAGPAGVAFSVGILGREGERTRIRRWAGGLPDEREAGAPGRLVVEREG